MQTGTFAVQLRNPSQLHQHQMPPNVLSQGNMTWHSGYSPYGYDLVILINRVKKCYGCGQDFAECYRRELKNIVVRHFDKRVKGKDAQGNLQYTNDFQAAYYHLNPSHIVKKNPVFNGRVSVATELWQSLSSATQAFTNRPDYMCSTCDVNYLCMTVLS